MSAIPRPLRAAVPGEIVNFFEDGDPSGAPIPAMVVSTYGGNTAITYHKPGDVVSKSRIVKHVHDAYWDTTTLQNKQASGAYDFHPVYGGLFDKWLALAEQRETKRKQLESEKNEMSADDFNACSALERHGDNMSAIATDTGLTIAALNKLPKFKAELARVKQENFEAKNAAK